MTFNFQTDTCLSCGDEKNCEWMNPVKEDPCCACARIPENKRCDWCRQDYIDSVAE